MNDSPLLHSKIAYLPFLTISSFTVTAINFQLDNSTNELSKLIRNASKLLAPSFPRNVTWLVKCPHGSRLAAAGIIFDSMYVHVHAARAIRHGSIAV